MDFSSAAEYHDIIKKEFMQDFLRKGRVRVCMDPAPVNSAIKFYRTVSEFLLLFSPYRV